MNNENAVKIAFTHIRVMNMFAEGVSELVKKIAAECGITEDEVFDHIEEASFPSDRDDLTS